jgi:alpha-glucosidase
MKQYKWWQTAVFYQIYPRSFADGNGDGIGDFKGMIGKLDYLKDLGVDAVWLSPHFPSPNVDCGYDISDYLAVAPEYGTMEEFKEFLDGLHQHGMRLVLDLVLNHTSDQHSWFAESRSSRDNPMRDWYIWKKGKEGKPPNNWYSTFGGSAWELDPATGEYYYHFFFKEQPDLNWHNPEVKKAMFDAARFWLDLGVDGFRLDAIGTLFEDERYPDQTAEKIQHDLFLLEQTSTTEEEKAAVGKLWEEMFQYQHDLPEVHEVMRELRQVVDEYPDRVLIGETDDIAFYGNGNDELHLNFNFPLMRPRVLCAEHVRSNQKERFAKLPAGAWPCNTLGNHDTPRMHSFFGDGVHDDLQARLHLLLLLTLKGTPFLYNGEEIGMRDFLFTDSSLFRDSMAAFILKVSTDVFHLDHKAAALKAAEFGRDKNRTPMQWSNTANAGFSPAGVQTWLPVNPNYVNGVNVKDQENIGTSLFECYRRLLKLRKNLPALQIGKFEENISPNKQVYSFFRYTDSENLLIVCNLGQNTERVIVGHDTSILFSSKEDALQLDKDSLVLSPFTGGILNPAVDQYPLDRA